MNPHDKSLRPGSNTRPVTGHGRPRLHVTQGTRDAEILRCRANGMSIERIGAKLGCSAGTVKHRFEAMRASGQVVNKPKRKLLPISAGACDQLIKRMRSEGRTLAEMGRTFGCSDRVVVKRIAVLQQAGEIESLNPGRRPPCLVDGTLGRQKPERLQRTPELDTLFIKAVTSGISMPALLNIFQRGEITLEKWKRDLGLTGTYTRPRAETTERDCLGWCGRKHRSMGAGDRICDACKNNEIWRSGLYADMPLSGVLIRDR